MSEDARPLWISPKLAECMREALVFWNDPRQKMFGGAMAIDIVTGLVERWEAAPTDVRKTLEEAFIVAAPDTWWIVDMTEPALEALGMPSEEEATR